MAPKARIRLGASRIDAAAAATFARTDVRASAGERPSSRGGGGGVVDEGRPAAARWKTPGSHYYDYYW